MHTQLIIIGAGPGGYETALSAARRGMEVTLIEAGEIGGTCLNEGCIPTKAYCRSAALLGEVASAAEFGVRTTPATFDFKTAKERKDAVVAQLKTGIETLLTNPKIHLVKGKARFVGPLTVTVADETYTADDVIIATGSVSASLPIPGTDLPGVITSREILSMETVPNRLCIVGGGVIGLEFASVFKAFGSEVTVLEYAKEVLPHFDSDMAKRLRQSMGKKGIAIETQAAVSGISQTGDSLSVTYEKKGKTQNVEADIVLMAVGRRANTTSLNLEDIGVAVERRGITVDSSMRTNVPHVYAIGDVNGLMMLAHAATFQGIRALNSIQGIDDKLRLDVMPAAVFTSPEVATVGLTEDDCKTQGITYTAKKAFFRAVGKAVCLGETEGYCKLLTGSDDSILGCHIYGPHASDLVQEVCALMTAGAKLDVLKQVIHTHPTLCEIVQTAAHN